MIILKMTNCCFQDEIFKATQRFVILKDLSVKMACCSADTHFEDSVITVRYVPVTSTAVIAAKNVNGDTTNSDMKAGGQAVSHGGSSSSRAKTCSEEEDDYVDYYAYERKRKKQSHWRDRNAGVYNSLFPMKFWPINKWHSSPLGTFLTNVQLSVSYFVFVDIHYKFSMNEFILMLSVFMKIDQPQDVHVHMAFCL
jgi:hypothetical protein